MEEVIVTPVAHGLDLLKSELVRSPGLHASQIYGELFQELEPQRFKGTIDSVNPALLALGTAWEAHFEKLLILNGIHAERPEEFMSPEGIAFSPDLLIFRDDKTILGELKYTSMSARDMPIAVCKTLPPKMDKYLCQMKLYAYWLGLHDGWLAVLFNYVAYAPDLRVFELQWTDQELSDNHAMCINFARHKGLLV